MVVTVLCSGPCGLHARVCRNYMRQSGANVTYAGSGSVSSLYSLLSAYREGHPSPIWCIPWCGGQRLVPRGPQRHIQPGLARESVAPDGGVGCLAFHGIRYPASPAWPDRPDCRSSWAILVPAYKAWRAEDSETYADTHGKKAGGLNELWGKRGGHALVLRFINDVRVMLPSLGR